MNEPDRGIVEPGIVGAESSEPREIAREQFAHGLLATYHLDKVEDRERRIAALRLEMERAARVGWMRFRWRVVSGVAAGIALVAMVILGMPTQTSATAMVEASLAASEKAGDRRYEVRVKLPREEEFQAEPIGTLDVRDADHVLMRAISPFGDRIVVGRNGDATWAIRPDGTVDNYPPRHAWPRWVDFGQTTVLLVPVEELMTSLGKAYTLERGEAAVSPSGKGPKCDRISAVRKQGPTPEPSRVELWIDPHSHVVRRMELHWNQPRRPGPMDGPPPRRGPGGGPPPGPLGEDGEGRRHPGPDGLGMRPPPDGGPRPRPPHPPPEFLGGPPDFEGGRRPPPPRLMALELVDGVKFEARWFESAAHAE